MAKPAECFPSRKLLLDTILLDDYYCLVLIDISYQLIFVTFVRLLNFFDRCQPQF